MQPILLDWETVFLNATAATTPVLTFHLGALGDIPNFLKFRKCLSHTRKTLSFSNASSLETTHSTSENHPNGTRTRVSNVKTDILDQLDDRAKLTL